MPTKPVLPKYLKLLYPAPNSIGLAKDPKFLAFLVILCFEKRCPKLNTVARLKSKDLPPKIFWAGYATAKLQ